ncbi:unnamed protein product, partial [Cyprideis torosa]
MKAMILAAGKGTRMRPLTYELPKPMIPVLGKPVMEYIVEHLARHGVNEIMVNTSHLPQRIEQYFGDGRRWGVEMGYSFEGHIEGGDIVSTAMGSAGGIRKIHDFGGFFDDTFFVLCGDALIDVDLTRALREHWKSGAIASLIVTRVPRARVSSYGVVVVDENSRVESFQEKPSAEEAKSNLVNTGIYIFEPEVLDFIPSGSEFDIGSQLFPELLKQGKHVGAIHQKFHWIDIGQLRDYWDASQRLMRGGLAGVDMPGRQVREGVWTGLNVSADWDTIDVEGPVYVGAGTRLESGCRLIGPTWIGNACHIESGAEVCRSILFEYTLVRGQGCIED